MHVDQARSFRDLGVPVTPVDVPEPRRSRHLFKGFPLSRTTVGTKPLRVTTSEATMLKGVFRFCCCTHWSSLGRLRRTTLGKLSQIRRMYFRILRSLGRVMFKPQTKKPGRPTKEVDNVRTFTHQQVFMFSSVEESLVMLFKPSDQTHSWAAFPSPELDSVWRRLLGAPYCLHSNTGSCSIERSVDTPDGRRTQ